ncbi:hypothetical protein [Thermomonospora umbrina]|uniref:Uncharacterized protein n=1 Tax=Thermomonospora umbrina TaxID=111806 RepID=A0A3D9SQZ4_9ACTN|nr:hypothetical protein [Thermomonospora umbrina]REE95044.1 hypothetical protein DFJ69_0420 [Thermomonospora umbrina]
MTIGSYDARLNLLAVVDKGTSFTAHTLEIGRDFDVIADIEVGKALNALISRIEIFASLGSITQGVQIQAQVHDDKSPTPADAPRRDRITVPFTGLAGVSEGDILQASATLKVITGIWTDYSAQTSEFVIVTT